MMPSASFTSVHRGGEHRGQRTHRRWSAPCPRFTRSSRSPRSPSDCKRSSRPRNNHRRPHATTSTNNLLNSLVLVSLAIFLQLPPASSSFLTPSSLRLSCPTVESSLEIVDVCVRCTYYPFNHQLEFESPSGPLFEIPTSNPSAQVTVPINNTTTLYSSITHLTHCTHCTRNVR
jgi:hypothetical protein